MTWLGVLSKDQCTVSGKRSILLSVGELSKGNDNLLTIVLEMLHILGTFCMLPLLDYSYQANAKTSGETCHKIPSMHFNNAYHEVKVCFKRQPEICMLHDVGSKYKRKYLSACVGR